MERAMLRASCVLALAIGGPACTAITSGEFDERAPPLVCGNDLASRRRDFRLDLTEMSAHLVDLTQVDLVRIEDVGGARVRRSVARAVYDPLGAADLQIALPCAVLDGAHEADLFSDRNGSRTYDPCPRAHEGCADHQWRLTVQADGTVAYEHDVDFDDLSEKPAEPIGALPLQATLSNMDRFIGRTTALHLRRMHDDGTVETVFVYRLGAIREDEPTIIRRFDGVVDLRQRYQVVLWIDANGNGRYDAPSAIGVEGRDYATIIDAIGEPAGDPPDPGGVQLFFDGASPPAAEDVALEP